MTELQVTGRSKLDPTALLTFAVVLFGLSVRSSSPAAGLALALATVLCAMALWNRKQPGKLDPPPHTARQETRLFVAVLLFAGLGVLGWAPSWIGDSSASLERLPGLGWGLLAIWVFATRRSENTGFTFAGVTVVTLLLTLVVGVLHLEGARGVGIDVYLLHRNAASAIADVQNPYTDVVEVPDGAPTAAPGDTIVGYPYPPVAALAYSLGEWSPGDPRFTGLASWLAVLTMIGVSAFRRRNREGIYVLLLLASIPGWPLVLRAGWTEPLSLMFLVVAFMAWRRPTGSGIGLGLGLASKQYFALVAPLVILHRDDGWRRRLLVASIVVVVAVVPVLLLDPTAFWSAAVEFHANTPLRADSVNLIGALDTFGVQWAPPRWLGPAIGLVVAALAGRYSRTRESFFVGMALALAVSFLIASQAFANYWLLVTGLVAPCLIGSSHDADHVQPAEPAMGPATQATE